MVYCIQCPCQPLHIEETTQRLKDRIFTHKSEIQRGLTDQVHLIKEYHTVSHLRFQVIDSNPAETGW